MNSYCGLKKKRRCIFRILICCVIMTACGMNTDSRNESANVGNETQDSLAQEPEKKAGKSQEKVQQVRENETEQARETETAPVEEAADFMNEEGTTLETRILTPPGDQEWKRVPAEPGSFAEFLRNYPVKADGSPVLLYNGKEKGNQSAHVAVLKLPMEAEDLQQCADSVMRIYAEYFYQTEQYERILFHFVNGFAAEYTKWREGYRIAVDGNQVSWVKSAEYDESYETFVKYMRMVFSYAGTLSMETETYEISLEEIQAGDVFLMGGSPGHVVMVVDVCENKEGRKAFLLAQGYMPAQEFHVLKNPESSNDPWYYEEDISYPMLTPEYTFEEGSLKRLQY